MARLPQPGSDDGTWGSLLNDYLSQSHKADGTIKDNSIGAAQLQANAITPAAIQDGAITESLLDPSVQDKINTVAAAGVPNGSIGTAQLADGAVTNVKIADGAVLTAKLAASSVTDAKISATAAIAKTKLAPAVQTSLGKADTALQAADVAGKADDATVVHKAASETVTGAKDFTGGLTVNTIGIVLANDSRLTDQRTPSDASITDVKVSAGAAIARTKLAGDVQTSLGKADTAVQPAGVAGKADDATVVHKASAETITGAKDFTGGLTVNATGVVITTDSRLADQRTPSDASISNIKVAANAAISADKLADGTTNKIMTAAERTKLAALDGKLASASDLNTAGAAVGQVPTVTQASPLLFGLVTPPTGGSSTADLPEYAATAQTAAVGSPATLVSKTTRYDTTSASILQTLPAATAGLVLAIGWDAGTTNALTLVAAGSDVIGSGSATSLTVPLVGEVVTLHCTNAGRWQVVSGFKPQAALDARYQTTFDTKVDRTRFMLNARDFGVTATGSTTSPGTGTDDAAAITSLLATAATTGATVYFPRGVYRLGASVTMPAGGNFGMIGDGPGATIFQLDGTKGVSNILNLPNVATKNPNVTLRGFTLDGDKSHTSGNGLACGINLRVCDNLEISDIEVRNVSGKGIYHLGDAGLPVVNLQTWRRVYVHDCDGFFGIQNGLRTRKVIYDEVYALNNSNVGVWLDHSETDTRSIYADGNLSHGIGIHNVYMCNYGGLKATRNGGAGILVIGLVDSAGFGWMASNNGVHFVNGSLSTAAAAAATTISVNAGSNPIPVAGQYVTVGVGGTAETVKIRSVAGTGPYVCTLTTGLVNAHSTSEVVVGGRLSETEIMPTACADIYFSGESTGNYGVTARSQVTSIVAGHTSIGGEANLTDYNVYVGDGVTTDVRILDVNYPGAGRTSTIRLPATPGTLVYRDTPPGGVSTWQAGGPALGGGSNPNPILFAAKAADTTRTGTTTPIADPDLTVSGLVANKVYEIDGTLMYDTTQTGDIKYNATFPSGTLTWWLESVPIGTTTTTSNSPVQWGATGLASAAATTNASIIVAGGTANANGTILSSRLKGLLRVGGTGGSFTLNWSQNTSDASNCILKADSSIKLTQVT